MSNFWRNAASSPHAPRPQTPDPVSQPTVAPTKAASAHQRAVCPSCASVNYRPANGNIRDHCYDCGWPLQQTGTGMTATSTQEAAPRTARQIDRMAQGDYTGAVDRNARI